MWAIILYRGIRAGVSAGIVAVLALKIDLSDPKKALQVVAIAFGTGFLVCFGKWLRELLDKQFGYDEKSVIAKVMPV